MSYENLSQEELVTLLEERDASIESISKKINSWKDAYRDEIIGDYEKEKSMTQIKDELSKYDAEYQTKVMAYIEDKGLSLEEAMKLSGDPEASSDDSTPVGSGSSGTQDWVLDLEEFSKLNGSEKAAYIQEKGHNWKE